MKTFKLVLLCALALLGLGAQASGSATSTVSQQQGNGTGQLVTYFTTAPTGQPACSVTHGFGLDVSTAAGKSAASLLTTAMLAGKTVAMYGTGVCTTLGNTEDVYTFIVYQ